MNWYDRETLTPHPIEEFRRWPPIGDRRIARTEVGDVEVSTVFLVLDHQHLPGGPPILFETMIFGGPYDLFVQRYATEAEAGFGHRMIVAALEAGQDPRDPE